MWWRECECWECAWCIGGCWEHNIEVEELGEFLKNNWGWTDISELWYPEGMWGEMGVIGVIGDVVVEELNAGDIDWSSEVHAVVFKWLR